MHSSVFNSFFNRDGGGRRRGGRWSCIILKRGEANYQGRLVCLLHLCFILRVHCSVFNSFLIGREGEGGGEAGGFASSSKRGEAKYQGRLVFLLSSLLHIDESRGTCFT